MSLIYCALRHIHTYMSMRDITRSGEANSDQKSHTFSQKTLYSSKRALHTLDGALHLLKGALYTIHTHTHTHTHTHKHKHTHKHTLRYVHTDLTLLGEADYLIFTFSSNFGMAAFYLNSWCVCMYYIYSEYVLCI